MCLLNQRQQTKKTVAIVRACVFVCLT